MEHSHRHPALVLSAAMLTGLWVLAAAPAMAHDQVIETTPGVGESVSDHPVDIIITTSGELLDLGGNSAGFAIIVNDEAGLFYGDGCVTVEGISLSTSANLGDTGTYTVTYQYISGDGHTLSGEYGFDFERPEDYLPAAGQSQAPVCGEPPVYPLESTNSDEEASQELGSGEAEPAVSEPSAQPTTEPAEGRVNSWWGTPAPIASIVIPLGLGAALVYWFARRKPRQAN